MAAEVLYPRNLLANLGFPGGRNTPVYEHRMGSRVTGGRERAKQVGIRKRFAHTVMQERAMKPRGDQLADMFTKQLPYPQLTSPTSRVLQHAYAYVREEYGLD